MAFSDFRSKYENQPNVGDTSANIGQCVGLIECWIDYNGSLPHIWGDAKDLYKDADPNYFALIENTPTAIPIEGDIIVWTGAYNGGVGHTGVATGKNTDVNKLEVFEQNDPIGSKPHVKSYNYAYIQGWIRIKKYNVGGIIPTTGQTPVSNPSPQAPTPETPNATPEVPPTNAPETPVVEVPTVDTNVSPSDTGSPSPVMDQEPQVDQTVPQTPTVPISALASLWQALIDIFKRIFGSR